MFALLCAPTAAETNPVVLVRPERPPEPPMPRPETVAYPVSTPPAAGLPWRGVTVVHDSSANGPSEEDVRGYLRAEAAKRKARKAQKAARKRQRSGR
jgi:hypothetical protein